VLGDDSKQVRDELLLVRKQLVPGCKLARRRGAPLAVGRKADARPGPRELRGRLPVALVVGHDGRGGTSWRFVGCRSGATGA
jgi:hypothetical protein